MCIGYYFTGDGALRDESGDLRITGRVDDVVNIKGHRIGTAEIECAMVGFLFAPLKFGQSAFAPFITNTPSVHAHTYAY